MVDINSSFKGFEQPKSEDIKIKNKAEKADDKAKDAVPESVELNVFSEPDSTKINTDIKSFGKAVNSVSFGEKSKDIVGFLSQKEDLSPDELKILELISKTNDDNLKAILDAFDKMLEHSRKMMEQYKEYVKKVVIPKEESMKIETQKEEIRKEIHQNK